MNEQKIQLEGGLLLIACYMQLKNSVRKPGNTHQIP